MKIHTYIYIYEYHLKYICVYIYIYIHIYIHPIEIVKSCHYAVSHRDMSERILRRNIFVAEYHRKRERGVSMTQPTLIQPMAIITVLYYQLINLVKYMANPK